MGQKLSKEERQGETWRKALAEGELPVRWYRRMVRHLPSSPRCGMCLSPFSGLGGLLLKPTGFSSRSRKNPSWCRVCFEHSPVGGAEVPTGVLFADVRGYTAYSEGRSPQEIANLLNRLYRVAVDVLVHHNAVIDKLVGDEVMALWLPGFAGKDTYVEKMIAAAQDLLTAVGYGTREGPWLPLGLGLDHGLAFVGNVGSGEVKDFTALGDVVNTAARLQSHAKPGQIVMSERVYEHARTRYPDAVMVMLDLKGKSEAVPARVVDLNAVVPVE